MVSGASFHCAASGSHGCLYLYTHGDCTLVLDPGCTISRWREVAAEHDLLSRSRRLTVWVSHAHRDHCQLLPELDALGVQVACTEDVRDELIRCKMLQLKSRCIPVRAYIGGWQSIGDWSIWPVPLAHDAPGACGLFRSNNSGAGPLDFARRAARRPALLYLAESSTYPVLRIPPSVYVSDLAIEINHDAERLLAGTLPAQVRARIARTHASLETVVRWIYAMRDQLRQARVHVLHVSGRHGNRATYEQTISDILAEGTQ